MENEPKFDANKFKEPTYWWVYLLQYGISLLVGVGLFFLVLYFRDYWHIISDAKKLNAIADGLTIPGILYLSIAVLVLISNAKAFTGVKYALVRLAAFLLPFTSLKDKRYEEIAEKEKKINGTLFLFVVGALFLIASIIFIIVNKLY